MYYIPTHNDLQDLQLLLCAHRPAALTRLHCSQHKGPVCWVQHGVLRSSNMQSTVLVEELLKQQRMQAACACMSVLEPGRRDVQVLLTGLPS
jgi:hypothetical protein